MTADLIEKIALVTGASRGIGRAIACAFAREGAVVALAARNAEGLEKVADEIASEGGTARVLPCDVSDLDAVNSLVTEIAQEFGGIDILVNNAASNYVASVTMSNERRWEELFGVNVFGTYYCTKAALRHMIRAKSGRIITISSVAGKLGAAHGSAYAATKAAVMGFSKSVARETARYGITVNCICPWHVDTELMNEAMENRGRMFGKSGRELIGEIIAASPQRRLITPEEVAALSVFLASPAALGITGQSINICGGSALE